MSTIKALCEQLGVTPKTITNQKKLGFSLVLNKSRKIDLTLSVHAFVKHQSEMIRKMKAGTGQKTINSIGNSRISKPPKTIDDWKLEKEKEGAIKLRLQNEKDMGELIPVEAMIELYNSPLSLAKSKLLDLSNQIQKRIPLDPDQIETIDVVVRDALNGLNGKGSDELEQIISQVIERYSKYYSSTEESADLGMGES